MTNNYDFDYLVIGAGSGGIASAKRAAGYGAKVAVIEKARLGGTCVNVGCVPKKVMWNAASIAELLKHDAKQYGFEGTNIAENIQFDFPTLKKKRDAYIQRLNGIYGNGFTSAGVTSIIGTGSFVDAHTVQVLENEGDNVIKTFVSARHVLIATGGRPVFPPGEGIEEHAISSDGFFDLEDLPKKVVVVGAGYIAVELAGVLNGLGTNTHLVLRKGNALREFDEMIMINLDSEMIRQGITIHRNTAGVAAIKVADDGSKTVVTVSGERIEGVDCVLMAVGRTPNVETLNLVAGGVKLGRKFIDVDEYSNTSSPSIYALGDVCGVVELTPMAIAAGRRLADRLFGPEEYQNAKVSYEHVPTVVFSHPTIGTIGLSEQKAIEKYGEHNITVYRSRFANLFYGIFDMDYDDKPKTAMKVICAGNEEKVVGLHVIGMGSDEMLQGFGVAVKMGCTKADLDSCVAIHPTASEELVTMGQWGKSAQATGAKHSPLNGSPSSEPLLKSNM